MKVILVPVADRPECLVALGAAFQIAARLNANVIGCHVRAHRQEPRSRAESRKPLVAEDWIDLPGELSEEQVSLGCQGAHRLFEKLAVESGFQLSHKPRLGGSRLALWEEMVGTPSRVLSIVGPLADMIVMSRPGKKARGKSRAFLLAALMQAAQPVLVVPAKWKGPIGTRVLIAWNQSPEAANAVSACRGVLRTAERTAIVSCGPEDLPGPKATYLVQYLKHLGVKSTRIVKPGKHINAEIEEAYKEQQANLVLMGGYSRGRSRELIFGGVTEHMLFHTSIPVLILHR
jgi:nucleotide-binding universal stress UspA family protein